MFLSGQSRKLTIAALFVLAISGLIWAMTAFAAKGGPTIVLFNASWCASCREVVPIVKEIAGQNNLSVAEIDVDHQDAPQQAKSYSLSIPEGDLPQAYYVNKGQATLLFEGRSFRYGQTDAIRATILQKIQQAKGK